MAAVTTVRELLWRVSGLLSDVAPQFNRWTEVELVNWLNDGQLAITKFLPAACSRVLSMKLRAGSLQTIETILAADCKLEDGSAPATPVYGVQCMDWFCNMGADGLTPGAAIPAPVDRRILDQNTPNWHAVTGTKVHQISYDPRLPKHFLVQPAIPAAPAQWLRIGLIAKPALIPNTGTPGSELYLYSGANAAVISIGDENVDDLVNYVCARAYMKNANFAANDPKVVQYSALFTSSLNARVTALTGNNPNLQRLPMAPEPIGAAK